ncbi:MAG TPA: hypothetical protein VFW87_05110, partial [Pirellulales bacterium]|nr:hypothetical protein [Pirellulales bacterium]
APQPGDAVFSETPAARSTQEGRSLAMRPAPPPAGLTAPLVSSNALQASSSSDDASLDFRSIFGRTRAEQGKTILAAIGALTLLLRVRRAVRPSQPDAKKQASA